MTNFIGTPGIYNGLKVFINNNRYGANVKRTWKERLLSWPWKPWVKTRWDQNAGGYVIPDGQVLRFKDQIVGNAKTIKILEKAIDNQ